MQPKSHHIVASSVPSAMLVAQRPFNDATMTTMRPALKLLLTILFCSGATFGNAKERITVGLYHFPPFIVNHGDQVGGLAVDMLEIMNAHQDEFEFVALATSPATRHEIFKRGRYDMALFEQPEWGWQNIDVAFSEIFLKGGEVYIALAKEGRGQEYFERFDNKVMIGVRGYHYSFADFNSDPKYLEERFQMRLTPSNIGSINMLLYGKRGDIAVVTRSFLAQYLKDHPGDREKLLISDKLDQEYKLRIALRKNIALSLDQLNSMLEELSENGKFDALWSALHYEF